MHRRRFMRQLSATAMAWPLLSQGQRSSRGKRLGVSIASYRRGMHFFSEGHPAWQNALDVLEHCKSLDAGCLQIGVRGWTRDFAGQVRARREALDIRLEGQVSLPRNASELEDFDATVRHAKEAGARILRTVCLGGRRYETFKSLEAWHTFRKQSWDALVMAERIVSKYGVRLAVENHKDWRMNEQLDLLERLSSASVGVCFDFGNNLSLLEDPHVQLKALAPYVMTTHLKDMGVQEYEGGFLLSEVPLGEGMLDLKALCHTCEQSFPEVQFNLEMITRDPLKIPVWTDAYWITMQALRASELAKIMALVKKRASKKPLPTVSDKTKEEQLAYEEANVRACFRYAQTQLGL
jgi:3-oxoisoapionate decarboxylase